MKVTQNEVGRFLRAPDPKIRAVLVYGPDGGLVRERAAALVRAIADDPADPFRVADLAAAGLEADPARLDDEAAALSFTGGRRVVRVRDAADGLAPRFKDFLGAPPGEALVVLEAGDLGPRSPLRKLFEGASLGAAVACYRDDARNLPALIAETLRDRGLAVAPEAVAYLVANLGGDRQVTRRELEKLVLYKGEDGGRVELEDAQACVGDSVALSLEDVAFAAAGGDTAELCRALARGLQEGAQPVTALRAAARHFQRLHLVAALLGRGETFDRAAKRLRPPVFWKLVPRFEAQARGWPPAALAWALGRLLEAEIACKRTGAPAEVLCARALMEVAHRAPGRPRRRAG
ncbi:MAG: DNA polymerase III subunit delta [Kiloniellaceae bacterium]